MTRKMFRNTLLGATMLMGFGTGPAFAQDSAQESEAPNSADTIVVTATRRATSLQDVPINISAIGADELAKQRIDDVRDISDFTPGITIVDTGPSSTGSIVLRGLNASDSSATGDSFDNALGIYLGEVPLYYDFKLIDIARVEVLLGPQGTLYGLGTLAGAIRNIPNRPNLDRFEGEVHGRFYAKQHSGDLGYQADAVINIPIIKDHLAFRSATGYYFDPGFIDYPLLVQRPGISLPQPNGPNFVTPAGYAANLRRENDVNFEKTITTRNQLLYQASEDFKVILTYAFQQTKTDGGQYNSDGVFGTGRYQSAVRFLEPVKRRAHLASVEINANLGNIADLVATTAYTDVKNNTSSDITDLLLDLDYGYESFPAFAGFNENQNRRKQFNQEIRFVSRHGGPFNWVLGGFYNEQRLDSFGRERLPNHPFIAFGTQPNPDEVEYAAFTRSKVTEKAIFGEGTFRITPEWQVTAGARYYDYTSSIAGRAVLPILGDPISPFDLPPAGGDAGANGWVWKFNSSYNFTPDIMLYATYSKGYRVGGPNSVAPCGPLVPGQQAVCALPEEEQFLPDTTKNIEIGVRAQLFNRMLTVNANAFTIDWDGIQVGSATINGVVGITVNGGKGKAEGFETSFQLRPVPRVSIQGTYAYLDARLTQDVPALIAVNSPAGIYPSRPIRLDALAGDRLPGSARNSGSLGATYTAPLGEGSIVADWTATYRGSVVTRIGWDRAFGDKLPGFTTHRASVFYDTEKFSIGVFAGNIFDKYAVGSVSNDRSRVGLNDGVRLRYFRQNVINPRTFGIEARFKY
ncbi:MAG: TonB-dependent receptor [Blastomonas sp.]|jgi:iron complex outermembrane receptor protein|uniref:TonB-dependent receptor n=1 Tax=Blastomonas TaxID=150203 RepID=UPI0025860C1D|nr:MULTISPECIES: TonB-dependent receptor [Blastomonas]MCO5791618.1 TonB-dependent receptor [Blastomonas sp.]MDM7927975.1 TonB-dependent receptor [Blastomonas fulva]MDM7966588.1 TonB-dependent receptor [Blastomonas fulva]